MKKVLIIEDNEDNIYLMRKILQKERYDVIEASDGATGVELAINKKPNIIILDIQLPVLDGYSATKKIRENEISKEVIIIIISSYALGDEKKKKL